MVENKRLTAENKRLKKVVAALNHMNSQFIGSGRKGKKIRHFHRPDCKWVVDYLQNSPNKVLFNSHEHAVEEGYRPCKRCFA
jgi:methylphosphotriester-DNA--protein-cysteine methyltransferase